jgi:predicted  nucleic acid-binding Zn-ribbon protein
MFEEKLKEQNDQLTNMMEANFKALKEEREVALEQQKKLENVIESLKESLEKREEEIVVLNKKIEDAAKPSAIEILAPLVLPFAKILIEAKQCNVM